MDDYGKLIEAFSVNIYLNMPSKINEDYIAICEVLSELMDDKAGESLELKTLKSEILNQMLSLMEYRDYTRMSDYLTYELMPLIKKRFV